MPRLDLEYRLPSMVIRQDTEVRPFTVEVAGLRVTFHAPEGDDRSIRGGWTGGAQNPRYRYGDRLTVSVEVPADLQAEPHQVMPELQSRLQPILQRFLALLNYETKQIWVGFMPTPLAWHRYPFRWDLYDDNGQEVYGGGGSTTEPSVPQEYWLSQEVWESIGTRLGGEDELPLPQELLMEANAFRFLGTVRSSVLASAMACEVALKRFVAEVGGERDALYRYVAVNVFEVNMLGYLNDILQMVTGEDLKTVLTATYRHGTAGERKLGYRELQQLVTARNKVAHEGQAYYKSNSGARVNVDGVKLDDFMMIAGLFVGYLDSWRKRLTQDPAQPATPPAQS